MKYGDFKKEYDKVKEKHDLPKLRVLSDEVYLYSRISGLDEFPVNLKDFLIGAIRDHMSNMLNFLHSNIYGNNNSVIVTKQANFYTKQEKIKQTKIMYRLTAKTRFINYLFHKSKDEDIKHVKPLIQDWLEIKEDLTPVMKKAYTKWEEEHQNFDEEEQKKNYF